MNVRSIAFVLPQFHPIPENDEWWGKGFTEWTNVSKAQPLFEGHYQPHVPTDLGFYDLRLPEARNAQAELAKAHGIHGFCYYHYWFNGKRLLEYPVNEMLRLGEPDMPFMLCWANENWTRRWDGMEDDILMKQDYHPDDDEAHIRWLCEHVFSDPRYIRVDDCPVFLIYRHTLFPDIAATASLWRKIAKEEFGFKDLYLCTVESFNTQVDPKSLNFDAAVEFSPHLVIQHKIEKSKTRKFLEKYGLAKSSELSFRDFEKGVRHCMERKVPDYKLYRCVTPSWDNTPRKGAQGAVGLGSNPSLYFEWLSHVLERFEPYSEDENFVFINALNEWAEGNHMEPCVKYGTQYFEMTQKALSGETGEKTTNQDKSD
ncbi:MAG: glycoside hydrolase family 99-like domain-containing protein [Bacteroidota bacterium]